MTAQTLKAIMVERYGGRKEHAARVREQYARVPPEVLLDICLTAGLARSQAPLDPLALAQERGACDLARQICQLAGVSPLAVAAAAAGYADPQKEDDPS